MILRSQLYPLSEMWGEGMSSTIFYLKRYIILTDFDNLTVCRSSNSNYAEFQFPSFNSLESIGLRLTIFQSLDIKPSIVKYIYKDKCFVRYTHQRTTKT